MHYFIIAIQAIACAFIAFHSLTMLNKMSKGTAQLIRAAYAILAASGGAGLVGCFLSYDAFNCLFAVGVALFLIANQRSAKPCA